MSEAVKLQETVIDPITNEIMNVPVILPTSKINIDKFTIEQMLLSNPCDPFNRNPLRKEELRVNEELKEKIDAYKMRKKAEAEKKNG